LFLFLSFALLVHSLAQTFLFLPIHPSRCGMLFVTPFTSCKRHVFTCST
jgi:hypothetical protein